MSFDFVRNRAVFRMSFCAKASTFSMRPVSFSLPDATPLPSFWSVLPLTLTKLAIKLFSINSTPVTLKTRGSRRVPRKLLMRSTPISRRRGKYQLHRCFYGGFDIRFGCTNFMVWRAALLSVGRRQRGIFATLCPVVGAKKNPAA